MIRPKASGCMKASIATLSPVGRDSPSNQLQAVCKITPISVAQRSRVPKTHSTSRDQRGRNVLR